MREWRNLADAPDLGSGGVTLGGSSPPSRTTPPTDISPSWAFNIMELKKMKKLLLITLIACCAWLVPTSNAWSQFYSYYYPNYYAPPGYVSPPPVRQNTPPSPYYFRATPDPHQMWRLDRNNRWQDYQNRLRSPQNPESDLSYMLRTF